MLIIYSIYAAYNTETTTTLLAIQREHYLHYTLTLNFLKNDMLKPL